MKIRIMFLIDRLAFGGTEKQLIELINQLDRKRFHPHLCTLHESDRITLDSAVTSYCLDFRAFHDLSTARVISKLASYIRHRRIQIVQSFFQDPTLIAALSRPFHRASLVGSFRDLGFWRSRKETFKLRIACRAFNGFIANSKAVKAHFVKVDRIDPKKIEVIYNGIKIAPESKANHSEYADRRPIVGIVANLNRPVKRVNDFIRVASKVHAIMPGARFVVVGDGCLRPELENLSRSLDLENVLTFTGLVDNPIEQIERFRIGVITSETEGFCNSILEYMACGVPVVATAAGGNMELVLEGENGFLVPVGNIEMLAQKIIFLLKRIDICGNIGRYNALNVDKKFSMKKMVAKHEDFYCRLVRNSTCTI